MTSHPNNSHRDNLAGGGGAFSNFFDELADDSEGQGIAGGGGGAAFFGLPEEDDDLAILSNFSALRRGQQQQQQIPIPMGVAGGGGRGNVVLDSGQLLRQSISSQHEVCVTFYKRKQPKILHKRYMLGETIGRGSYGKVKDCLDLETLQRCAMKIVSKMMIRKIPGGMRHVEQEIELMRGLEHPNVIILLADFVEGERERRCMVLEYCLGSIHDLQAKGIPDSQQAFRALPPAQAHDYFVQVVEGVDFLHSRRIIHKDLKPGNMLLTEQEVVKITDFGISEQLPLFSAQRLVSGGQATPAFQPPEVALGVDRVCGYKLDIYSCGVSLYFMLVGAVPFSHPNMLHIFEQIAEGKYTIPDWVDKNAASLVRAMLHHDPENRYSLAQIRQHVWFRTLYPSTGGPPRLSPLDYLFPESRTNQLTVIPRLQVYYNWSGSDDSGADDPDEEGGQDLTYLHFEENFHRLGVGDTDDWTPTTGVPVDRFSSLGLPQYQQLTDFYQYANQAASLPHQHPPAPESSNTLAPSISLPGASNANTSSPESNRSTGRNSGGPIGSRVKLKKPSFCKPS